MSSRIRSSKVRHVYCDEPKQEFTYSGFTLDTTLGDHPFISCSSKYVSRACSHFNFVFLVICHMYNHHFGTRLGFLLARCAAVEARFLFGILVVMAKLTRAVRSRQFSTDTKMQVCLPYR